MSAAAPSEWDGIQLGYQCGSLTSDASGEATIHLHYATRSQGEAAFEVIADAAAFIRRQKTEIQSAFRIIEGQARRIEELERAVPAAAPASLTAAEGATGSSDADTMEDPIMVPRGLIGAACYVLRKNNPDSEVVAQLRALTFARPPAVIAVSPVDAPAPSEWISVAERLPARDVIVALTGPRYGSINGARYITTGSYDQGDFYDDEGDELHQPTHWMPLPAAPGAPA